MSQQGTDTWAINPENSSSPPLRTNVNLFQQRKFRGLVLLAALLAIALVACSGSGNNSGSGSDNAAPDFPIQLYQGEAKLGSETLNFADLQGKPVVLNFWAGLCPPCRAEMPDLQRFYDEFEDRTILIGVDVGQFTGLGNQADATALLNELGVTYPSGFTTDARVMQKYGIISMPTTLFITAEGEIFRKWSGALNQDVLARVTTEMLSQ